MSHGSHGHDHRAGDPPARCRSEPPVSSTTVPPPGPRRRPSGAGAGEVPGEPVVPHRVARYAQALNALQAGERRLDARSKAHAAFAGRRPRGAAPPPREMSPTPGCIPPPHAAARGPGSGADGRPRRHGHLAHGPFGRELHRHHAGIARERHPRTWRRRRELARVGRHPGRGAPPSRAPRESPRDARRRAPSTLPAAMFIPAMEVGERRATWRRSQCPWEGSPQVLIDNRLPSPSGDRSQRDRRGPALALGDVRRRHGAGSPRGGCRAR
jgi:hypothetical protein